MIVSLHEPVEKVSIVVRLIRWNVMIRIRMRSRIEIRRLHQRINDAPWHLRHGGCVAACARGAWRWRWQRRRVLLVLCHGRLVGAHDGLHLLLVLLLSHVLVGPTPLLLGLGLDEIDAPARFLFDLLQNGKDFFLLLVVGQTLGCNCQTPDSGAGDTSGRRSVPRTSSSGIHLTCP